MKIGLISCCNKKLPFETRAALLYRSTLFRLSVQAAKAVCDDWAILSAKHGLVMPNDVLIPYDERLTKSKCAEWDKFVAKQIKARFSNYENVEFIFFAGRMYQGCAQGMRSRDALKGLGFGKRLQRLKQIINECDL